MPTAAIEDVLNKYEAAPAPEPPQSKLQSFTRNRVGISVLSFFVFLLTFVLVQPSYVLEKDTEGNIMTRLNFTTIFILSFLGALLVYFIPYLINK